MSTRARSKRLRSVSEIRAADRPERAPMRRLTPEQRRAFMRRFGRHLPLLDRTRGYLLVASDGDLRTAELWRGETSFVVGYLWRKGHLREASIVLPTATPILFVTIGEEAAA